MLELLSVQVKQGDNLFTYNSQVSKGAFCRIVGPSGAGKTTLLETIAGFNHIVAGEVSWQGQSFTYQKPESRPVSMMFQQDNLFAHLSVYTNIALGVRPSARLNAEERQQLQQLCVQLGIVDQLEKQPTQLSGGQQQRAALARAIIHKKPILLLDEPFSALDKKLREDCIALTDTMRKQYNLTVLMVTHHPKELDQVATQTIEIS
ncbi:ATP-binding cassette domain-containing protein [Spartinivicinus poritis]|uniref:ATP-binding cassette domain-containing protein n=1 Tax=Spartinivicinus poritis TaxID=2994640 RepID=A0ABT5U6G7_9GAMM|nr:ATP-binding cassette domain-containing protein [Spartinivicinus sp. A2-2]MDE1461053.1 ATP-binding cassette domain-containing protein [Spartinivicinus sp. A2-2]